MNDRTDSDRTRLLQDISALADGQADAPALHATCAQWHADPHLRASWHAYHLIGDVMRSEELATDVGRDTAFLGSLRERLAREPVILAPAAAATGSAGQAAGRWSWKAPAAVAASFMAVAAALLLGGGLPSGSRPPQVAQSLGPGAASKSSFVDAGTSAREEPGPAASVAAWDQSRMQRYLAAHRQFEGSSELGLSAGFLRASTSQTPAR